MYITRPMKTKEEMGQFITELCKRHDAGDRDGVNELCAAMTGTMKAAGYRDLNSFIQACLNGEEW